MPFHRALPYVDPEAPAGRLRRTTVRLLATDAMVAGERSFVFRWGVWRLMPRLLRLTGGRFARLLPFPVGLLETRDARNGRPHRRVVVYFHDGDRVTVVPSKAGMPADPFWFGNALADPDVRFGGQPFRAAPVEDDATRERLWALADGFYPACITYREHAARSGRTIPLLQLVPR